MQSNDTRNAMAAGVRQRGTPPPLAAWFPGTVLLWIGPWMIIDGGLSLGWAVCAFGLALVLVGAVAQGVAWGMGIHRDRYP